jgi:ribosomal protein S18 acetylase RimI-like enzyme
MAEERDILYLLNLCGATSEDKNPKIKKIIKEKRGKTIVGVCGVIKRHTILPAVFLAVNPKYQGQGIGKKLIKKLLTKYKGILFLTVSLSNKPAYNIYKQNGFVRILPWRKLGNKNDIWLMIRL